MVATDLPTASAAAAVELMRQRSDVSWDQVKHQLKHHFDMDDASIAKFDKLNKEELLKGYEMMQLCRLFENACNQAYMQGNIRGFMHLDNGQETIPAMVADSIKLGDKKHSYYREHTHAIASGVDPKAVMAELFAKEGGTCKVRHPLSTLLQPSRPRPRNPRNRPPPTHPPFSSILQGRRWVDAHLRH